MLYRPGDPADNLFAVVSGTVSVKGAMSDGSELDLGLLGSGKLFGVAALIPGGAPRAATATVESDAVIVEFNKDSASKLKASFGPEPAVTFMRNVLKMLADQIMQILSVTNRLNSLVIRRHPDYPLDPASWVKTVESALPSGLLAGLFRKSSYKSGTEIIGKGSRADGFFFLKEGTIKANDVAELAAPNVFGQLAFFADAPSPASFVASSDCEITQFPEKSLDGYLKKHPEEGYKLLEALLHLMVYHHLTIDTRR